jgi:hypothetical protein
MNNIAVVASLLLWMVIAQPLDSIQHSALMDFYNGLGSFSLAPQSCVKSDVFFFSLFFFFFFFSQDAIQQHVLDSRSRQIALGR